MTMNETIRKPEKGWLTNVVPEGAAGPERALLALTLLFLLAFVYMVVCAFFGRALHLPGIPGGPYGKLVPPFGFAFLYLSYTRGFRSSLFLAAFAAVYCWLGEESSVHTGFPFGHYYYSGMLGYKLDVVPITIGLNYFWIYIVPALALANLIVQGNLFGRGGGRWRLLFTSFVASVLVSGIDMAVDPLDATKLSEWVWTKNSYTGFYGIPYMNYLGYVLVMTPLFFLYGLYERRTGSSPRGPVNVYVAALPLFFYFLLFLLYGIPAPSGVFLVACFTMGLPLVLAADRLVGFFARRGFPADEVDAVTSSSPSRASEARTPPVRNRGRSEEAD